MDSKLSLEDKVIMVSAILAGGAMSLALVGWASKKINEKRMLKFK